MFVSRRDDTRIRGPDGATVSRRWALAAGVHTALLAACGGEPVREPASLPNPGGPVVEVERRPVPHVVTITPAESLVLDPVAPTNEVRLLFFRGRAAHPDSRGGALVPIGGGAFRVSSDLRFEPLALPGDRREIRSVAPGPGGGHWLATGQGEVLRTDATGQIVASAASPFEFPALASDLEGAAWLVRSPGQLSLKPPGLDSYPLLFRVAPDGALGIGLGTGMIARDRALSGLANSGYVATAGAAVFYAPYLRDELFGFSSSGKDTLWVASRTLVPAPPRPEVGFDPDAPGGVRYTPVQLGLAVGPDGRLYALSAHSSGARLDVLDMASGEIVRSTSGLTTESTVAADSSGRVYLLDDWELPASVSTRPRPEFRPFDLELLAGGRLTSEHIRGKVALINLWASWCLPCRVEMPALDRLRHAIQHPDFVFLTMNEDVRRPDATRFLSEFDFDFPVLLGGGKLKAHYHYVGLPMTFLVDRNGRIAGRWIGFAGDRQVEMIEVMVRNEVKNGEM